MAVFPGVQARKRAGVRPVIGAFRGRLVGSPNGSQLRTTDRVVLATDIRSATREPNQASDFRTKALETKKSCEPRLVFASIDSTTRRIKGRRAWRCTQRDLGHPFRMIGHRSKIEGAVDLGGAHPLDGVATVYIDGFSLGVSVGIIGGSQGSQRVRIHGYTGMNVKISEEWLFFGHSYRTGFATDDCFRLGGVRRRRPGIGGDFDSAGDCQPACPQEQPQLDSVHLVAPFGSH